MTANEAKTLLLACRPDGRDAGSPVFAGALALAEQDPELKAWWKAQQALDVQVSEKLQRVPIPVDLRATLLAGGKIEPLRRRYRPPAWLAVAATFLVLGVVGAVVLDEVRWLHGHLSRIRYADDAITFLGDDAPSLATLSNDPARLLAWLKEQNSPVGTIPGKMNAIPTVGCQTFQVKGHAVSLICFTLAGGKIVHLFMVDKDALADPPGGSPVFGTSGSWSTALWSDATKTYLLATEADPESLRQLL